MDDLKVFHLSKSFDSILYYNSFKHKKIHEISHKNIENQNIPHVASPQQNPEKARVFINDSKYYTHTIKYYGKTNFKAFTSDIWQIS